MRLRALAGTLVLGLLVTTHGHAQRPARAVIVTGENSFNGHVWKDTSAAIKAILDAGKAFQEVTVEPDPNFIATDSFLGYDVAVLDFRNAKPLTSDAQVQANLLKFLSQGRGLVTVHWANGAMPYWPEFVNIVGRAQQSVHDVRGPFSVKVINQTHPITKGLKDFQTDDELFWDTKEGDRPITILAVAHSKIKDKDVPMAMTVQYGPGRVFNTTMGHDVRALQMPGTSELIQRGTAWAAGILK
jgi:type 1 glutamine amidotransferase